MYDCIVIGKGPAGITASIYMKRSNLNCLVIGKSESALMKTNRIENYYGFPNSISGKELFFYGTKQAENLKIEMKEEEVISIEMRENFIVKTRDNEYEGKTILIATGTGRKVPSIKGIKQFEGKGISYCAICDSFFYRNKNVAVLGSGDYAMHEAEVLKPVAKSVVLITNGKETVQNRNNSFEEIETPIEEIMGESTVSEVRFIDGTNLKVEGIFVAEGIASSSDFARKLGIVLDETGKNIKVNQNMETNIPGVYAAGDCTGGILQISKAVYEGTVAGLSVSKKMREQK
ncbi:MAG TPA: FAD-dependent oxidoreductase [Candidatus Merdicola faecigallinarum]|uniref:FAD-dependent oxidoreductase n=1 Tax=Candidatus Merdicola faecigallinarum TaxID=2840862 RepID=A0A9D1M227_9FIRM|nr:FAD-dependent oxidoreductase [Candidatus Merdicola faecigallinarum]